MTLSNNTSGHFLFLIFSIKNFGCRIGIMGYKCSKKTASKCSTISGLGISSFCERLVNELELCDMIGENCDKRLDAEVGDGAGEWSKLPCGRPLTAVLICSSLSVENWRLFLLDWKMGASKSAGMMSSGELSDGLFWSNFSILSRRFSSNSIYPCRGPRFLLLGMYEHSCFIRTQLAHAGFAPSHLICEFEVFSY